MLALSQALRGSECTLIFLGPSTRCLNVHAPVPRPMRSMLGVVAARTACECIARGFPVQDMFRRVVRQGLRSTCTILCASAGRLAAGQQLKCGPLQHKPRP